MFKDWKAGEPLSAYLRRKGIKPNPEALLETLDSEGKISLAKRDQTKRPTEWLLLRREEQ